MTDSKEESKKSSNSKRDSASKDRVLSSSQAVSVRSLRLKEGILLVSLSLVIMVAAYFIYNWGFGMSSNLLDGTTGDGVCQSTENCLDQPEDCLCAEGEVCLVSDKQCVEGIMPHSIGDDMPDEVLSDEEYVSVLPPDPIELILENCSYNILNETISCKTNCLGNGNSTFSIIDSNNRIAIARESIVPLQIGAVDFGAGEVSFRTDHIEIAGSLISYSLSELNADSANWMVAMSCDDPFGSSSEIGVLRQ